MKFCRYCGAQLEDDAIFCDKCGSKLSEKAGQKPSNKEETIINVKLSKCPSCGSSIPSNAVACPYCGSEIRGREAVSSFKNLFDSLKDVESEEKKIDIIKAFPVPNNKEDIIEFMLMASSNFDAEHYADNREYDTVDGAWLAKIELCYKKSKMLFTARSDIEPIENIYQNVQNSIKKGHKKAFKKTYLDIILFFAFTATIGLGGGIFALVDTFYVPKPKEGQTVFVEYGYDYFKDKNYVDIQIYFESKGFEDVTLNPLHDLITGWVTKEGTVKDVSINGDTEFHKNRWYYPTDKVVINYHSF